jgi:hypothetical protein
LLGGEGPAVPKIDGGWRGITISLFEGDLQDAVSGIDPECHLVPSRLFSGVAKIRMVLTE